jgi:hypothetical protein
MSINDVVSGWVICLQYESFLKLSLYTCWIYVFYWGLLYAVILLQYYPLKGPGGSMSLPNNSYKPIILST